MASEDILIIINLFALIYCIYLIVEISQDIVLLYSYVN